MTFLNYSWLICNKILSFSIFFSTFFFTSAVLAAPETTQPETALSTESTEQGSFDEAIAPISKIPANTSAGVELATELVEPIEESLETSPEAAIEASGLSIEPSEGEQLAAEPTESNADPVEPTTDSTEPAAEPIESSADPVEPAADPTESTPDPSVPAKPGDATLEGATEQPEELSLSERQRLLMEGDRFWQQGQFEQAEFLYRKAKNPFQAVAVSDRPAPIYDIAQLSPGGQVYWRESQTGQDLNLETRMLVPMGLLTEQYPQFIPGHLRYTELLLEGDRPEDAMQVLERATALYPNETDLVRTQITVLADQRQWLEASIAARQFAVLNPDHPAAPEFTALATQNLEQHQSHLRTRLTNNAIANVLTGALSYALTGGLFGPLSAIQSTVLLLRGESDVGEGVAERLSEELELVQDEEVVAYVNNIGERLASVSGRDEFDYEFYIVQDDELNAFALPGGKIFINAGAILEANSEAELAGLLAHEIAHAVLSHGFQLVTESNVTANVLQFIPYGGIAADLVVLSYSRDMERQADILATRMLATSGYAADGLHNLMVTLEQSDQPSAPLEWLSTHPDTDERIRSMQIQIEQNGYNRYAYEGVEQHIEMQQQIQTLMGEEQETEK